MSVRHCKSNVTAHALERMKERGLAGDGVANSRIARVCGVTPFEVERECGGESELAMFLTNKQMTGKKAKIYNGYVFIFFSTSDRCITCYELPGQYAEEYSKVKWLEAKHRKDYRKARRK